MCVKSFKISRYLYMYLEKTKDHGWKDQWAGRPEFFTIKVCVCEGGGGGIKEGIVSHILFQSQGHSEWSKVTCR